MKPEIHPKLHQITVSCACGHSVKTLSTIAKSFAVEICANCHPYFTGKQKLIDTAGKVEKFQKKYAAFAARAKETAKKTAKKTH